MAKPGQPKPLLTDAQKAEARAVVVRWAVAVHGLRAVDRCGAIWHVMIHTTQLGVDQAAAGTVEEEAVYGEGNVAPAAQRERVAQNVISQLAHREQQLARRPQLLPIVGGKIAVVRQLVDVVDAVVIVVLFFTFVVLVTVVIIITVITFVGVDVIILAAIHSAVVISSCRRGAAFLHSVEARRCRSGRRSSRRSSRYSRFPDHRRQCHSFGCVACCRAA